MWVHFGTLYSISLIYVCFCTSTMLFLITVTLQYSLESRSMIPSALFFFLKIVFNLWGLLCYHTIFRIICPSSVKNAIGVLIGIALNLYIALGSMVILTIFIFPTYEHRISFHLFVSSSVALGNKTILNWGKITEIHYSVNEIWNLTIHLHFYFLQLRNSFRINVSLSHFC